MSTQFIYSPATIVFIWGNIDVIRYKWYLAFLGVGELLFAAFIWIIWALGGIQSVRPLWFYCGIYYIVFIFIWIMNIMMSTARSPELFLFAWFANIFVFAVTSFVLGLILYDLAACGLGYIPISCRDTYWIDIPVAVITFFLWLITLGLVLATTMIIGRIRQSSNVKGILREQQPPASMGGGDNDSTYYGSKISSQSSSPSFMNSMIGGGGGGGNTPQSGVHGNGIRRRKRVNEGGTIVYDPAIQTKSNTGQQQQQLYSTRYNKNTITRNHK